MFICRGFGDILFWGFCKEKWAGLVGLGDCALLGFSGMTSGIKLDPREEVKLAGHMGPYVVPFMSPSVV